MIAIATMTQSKDAADDGDNRSTFDCDGGTVAGKDSNC